MRPEALRYELPESEQRKRLLGAHALNLLPYPLYRHVVAFLKRNRKSTAFDCHPQHPQGARGKARVWLTQDIDTRACWNGLPAILDLQEKRGLRSTTHFLTRGPYRLKAGVLDGMERRGFETGLHGETHDAAIGFRREREMRRHLTRGLEALQRQPLSYRAPAMGVSETLLHVLGDMNFRLDSSIPMQLFYRDGVAAFGPYLYPGTKIVEAPVTLQDVNVMGDMRLSDDQVLALFAHLLDCLKAVSGTFVFNVHPVHMSKRLRLYDRILAVLVSDPDIVVIRNSEALTAA